MKQSLRAATSVKKVAPLSRRPRSRAAPLAADELAKIDAYWRAANYLAVGQIYLYDNPLLKVPLTLAHIKPRLLGHWGTTPGLNFIYTHLNRVIVAHDLSVLFVTGPGHGGPALVASTYLEGTYTERYPEVTQDEAGMRRLFKQFSFPGGIPSHVAAETPGSIHEGGELGYALAHAYGAAFDNPDLLVACVIGDGEAETGPLAASWQSNKFLNPARDGAVLPILHLNGYKIAGPTVLARIPRNELEAYLVGVGHVPYFVEGDDPLRMHQDGKKVEGTFRSHQVPLGEMHEHPEHVALLERWMKRYKPRELFDADGRFRAELAALAPAGNRRMGMNPQANGGTLLVDLRLPDYRNYAVDVPRPGGVDAEATRVQGSFIRDVMKSNARERNFRAFSPDEMASNRWNALFDVTDRCSVAGIVRGDDHVAPDGRVMEVLSEHMCEGWLEGYLLSGRHGFFSCYEAFIHIVDSMFNQHAKWLKVSREIPWRAPIASLNILLSSHVWRQDHNGFSHQDPGFIDHVVNKKAETIRVYLPPDANTLLWVTDTCLKSRHLVNVIVAGKQPAPQWLPLDAAIRHCEAGVGIWEWASSGGNATPDVVMACCGDVPTLETLAAVSLLREHLPELKVRVVNVVDLMKLQPASEHPNGLSDEAFDALFTRDRPIIFAFHGYPWLIHRLTYRRTNHDNLHVRGYKEEGTTTTPFDMTVLNDLDRFDLVSDVIERTRMAGARAAQVKEAMQEALRRHTRYIDEHGEDMPEIRDWRWPG